MLVQARIDTRYEIKEILGQGGMGVVYKAYDSQRKGYVALKTMKDAADPAALELFAQEWRTLANISHPNIVDVLNSGEFEEQGDRKPYFVMPLLPGRTLDKLIRDSNHRLTVQRVVEILVQACRGLQAAHAGGLIHRDLKPSNLFIMNDDSVKIIDFGMVHLVDVRRSVTGLKGTLQYMAPEQLELKEVTTATDIFSLGVVAFEALTGRKPFDRGNEGATAQAIRYEFPPPISEFNPAVSKVLAQVVAKAIAKGPWNRFQSAREFGEFLQKAVKGDAIEAFEAVRIQPRIERARRALSEGDCEYAGEILNELQLEGHVDSEITLLLEKTKEMTRNKIIYQLLDSARTRLQEEEYPLAWQKVQEALQRDPGNREAQALQAEIETRRSDQQMDKWRQLVHQHLHNHAFMQARHAIEEIRKIGRQELEIAELAALVDRNEKEFQKACDDKEQQFQSAIRAYDSGEISTAISKLEKILELEGSAPGFNLPGRDQVYRETYNKIHSEWEAVHHAVAEIEKIILAGDLARAAEMSSEQAAKYPNDFGLQALRLKVEDLQRQEKSAYIAEIGRRIDSEPDLDKGVKYLDEALARYPKEPHFQELSTSHRKRRDLVNSIVAKARQYEEQTLVNEALGQWNTLRSIHPQYPGLDYEIERVQKRCEQQMRDDARQGWVNQIDQLLQSSDYNHAHELATEVLSAFPGDHELQTLERLAHEGRERSSEAAVLLKQAQILCLEKRFPEAINLLRRASLLDPNSTTIRAFLADGLAGHAQVLMASDWRQAEALIQEALQLIPSHALAKSIRPSILLAKRMECIDRCVAEARALQAEGAISGALAKVQQGLVLYPTDARLLQLQNTLRNTTAEQERVRRSRDLEELKQLSTDVRHTSDQTSLTALLDRSILLSQLHPQDNEFSAVVSDIQRHIKLDGQARNKNSASNAASSEEATAIFSILPRTQSQIVKSDRVPWWIRGGSVARTRVRVLRVWMVSHLWVPLWRIAQSFSGSFTSPMARFKQSRIGRLSWTLKAALTLITLTVATLAILFLLPSRNQDVVRPGPPSPQLFPVTFTVNVPGTSFRVNGKQIEGSAANLKPGVYTVVASKEGYKNIDRHFTINGAATVPLNLEPEPQAIHISADLPSGKVFLDGSEIGSLQDGTLIHNFTGSGTHVLRIVGARAEICSVTFEAQPGKLARLAAPPLSRTVPVAVVSNLGRRALVYSSEPGIRATLNGGDFQKVPLTGLEFTLLRSDNELTFDDGKNPVKVPVEPGNAPVLSIRAGIIIKGTLVVEVNVDGAEVYVNGRKSSRPARAGKWMAQLEPGDYKVRVALDGYSSDAIEQRITVAAGKSVPAKFALKRLVTTAFLRVEGGTEEAEILVDGREIGKLDTTGSLVAKPIAPDADHIIRIQRENYEPSELKRHASVRQTINLTGADARLKPFGTLVFDVQPADAYVTFHRRGEPSRKLGDKTLHVAEGTYTVRGAAEGYNPVEKDVVISSGQRQTIPVILTRKTEAALPQPPPRAEITDLFVPSKTWKADEDGYWLHEGPLWFKQAYFSHIFQIQRAKKSFGRQEKIRWQISTQDDNFLEFEVDGTNFLKREVLSGKRGEWVKLAHGLGQGEFYRLQITVEPEQVTIVIGKVKDTIQRKIQGRTGFTGKLQLKLVQ